MNVKPGKPHVIPPGTVTERGVLPNGVPYRIWRGHYGRVIAYIGEGEGRRRSVSWIRKVLKGKRHPNGGPVVIEESEQKP